MSTPYPPPPSDGWPPRAPMTGWEPEPPPDRTADVVVTIALLVALVLAGAIASFFGLFLGMMSDPCGSSTRCSYTMISWGVGIAVLAPWIALLPCAVWAIVRMARREVAWWVPLISVPVWLGLFVGAIALAANGVDVS